jgi:hypothetical protein
MNDNEFLTHQQFDQFDLDVRFNSSCPLLMSADQASDDGTCSCTGCEGCELEEVKIVPAKKRKSKKEPRPKKPKPPKKK